MKQTFFRARPRLQLRTRRPRTSTAVAEGYGPEGGAAERHDFVRLVHSAVRGARNQPVDVRAPHVQVTQNGRLGATPTK